MGDVTLAGLLLNMRTCRMCSSRSPLALAHMQDATLAVLLLHVHTSRMLRQEGASRYSFQTNRAHAGSYASSSSLELAHARCYTSRSCLALAHMQDVTLPDLLLHLHTCVMLH